MLFHKENGYTPDYIYGNYLERVGAAKRKMKKEDTEKASGDDDNDEKKREADKVGNMGLKDLISGESGNAQILRRNVNANSGSTSDSELEECVDCCYEQLKDRTPKVKLSYEVYRYPYCPGKKKPVYQFSDLVQYASEQRVHNELKRSRVVTFEISSQTS